MTEDSLNASESLAVIFADICQSTTLYEKVGDALALEIISETFHLLEGIIKKHGGTALRTLGDEVLCSFPTAWQAGLAACEMHRSVKEEPFLAEHAVSLRVGLNYGPVIHMEGDIYGDTVNIAARAVGLAKKNQIITTKDALDNITSGSSFNTRPLGRIGVKGKDEELDVFEILWQDEQGLTRADSRLYREGGRSETDVLTLKYGGDTIEVGKGRNLVYLGRSQESDVVVRKHFVSRMHASIEYRNGKFILADHSTNGLYMEPLGAKPLFVHRDSVTLLGEGHISLGREPDQPGAQLIRFFVK